MMLHIVTKASEISISLRKPMRICTFVLHLVSILKSVQTLYTIALCELCGLCAWGVIICTN